MHTPHAYCHHDTTHACYHRDTPYMRAATLILSPWQVDQRANNHGHMKQGRSPHFKMRCIREFERIHKQYPSFRSEAVALTADSFNVCRKLLRRWIRDKESIAKKAKGKNKHQFRDRKQRGKFSAAEQEIFRQFCEARKKGKRVGPRWLQSCARREVPRAYIGTPMEQEAKKFGAKLGWLRRFCSRFNLSLRRKTNVKQKPIAERLPKIRRFFALFRIRLQSMKGKPGYCKKYGLFPLKNRWSLDQVPAGFFDPKSTYDIKGAHRVHIASNGSADSHRECTLQACMSQFYPCSLIVLPNSALAHSLCCCFRCAFDASRTKAYRGAMMCHDVP